MRWLVSFDIACNGRRRRATRLLLEHGERVQESVFELALPDARWQRLRDALSRVVDAEHDHWRAWRLCADDRADTVDVGLPAPAVAPEVTVV